MAEEGLPRTRGVRGSVLGRRRDVLLLPPVGYAGVYSQGPRQPIHRPPVLYGDGVLPHGLRPLPRPQVGHRARHHRRHQQMQHGVPRVLRQRRRRGLRLRADAGADRVHAEDIEGAEAVAAQRPAAVGRRADAEGRSARDSQDGQEAGLHAYRGQHKRHKAGQRARVLQGLAGRRDIHALSAVRHDRPGQRRRRETPPLQPQGLRRS